MSENEKQLIEVRAKLPSIFGSDLSLYKELREDELRLERAVAAEKNEEYAVTIDFPYSISTGCPSPQLIQSEQSVTLIFNESVNHNDWKPIPDSGRESEEGVCVVTFEGCSGTRFGAPNEEVMRGHPLYGRGAEHYSVQKVANSRWLKEIMAINSVHDKYSPGTWTGKSYYIFWFHDSTFECLARKFNAERYKGKFMDLVGRILSDPE